ncbi:MAG: protein kinase [Gemmatimonadetes bacterium]|nr:protein kinase [Gemmatimonadota bacterium]
MATDLLRPRLSAALGDRFTLERELTGGGMARVFVAHEAALNRRVVIKTLAPEVAASLSTERFDREIQLVAALQQANIVGVLTSGAVDGVPWFAMPFVEGDSLRARLAGGPVGESEAVGILRDVARALAYAHDRGVVHRDIKPDNILLSGDAAVVTDFGIAKAVTAARTQAEATPATGAAITSAGISLGTPAYMAPEQAAADTNVDRRADLYALGCVAYELVTGHPPFTGGSAAELLRAHLLTPPPAIPTAAGVSRGYAALVARCLAKDPAQRPASARDVLRALEQLGGVGEPAGAPSGLAPALVAWAATLGATYVLARAAVVGIGLPDFTVAWATGAAALGLPAVLATWWIKRTARKAQLATPTWTPGGTLTQTTLAGLAIKASPYATWRRTRRAGWVVIGTVTALAAGAAGIIRARAVAIPADARVLVADFAMPDANAALGEALTQAMRSGLQSSEALRLVSPSEVGAALHRMQQDPATPLSRRVAREVAQRAGIPLLVTGQVAAAGTGFVVSVQLVDPASDSVLVPLQRAVSGPGELIRDIDWLARRLRERVGESLRAVNRTPPLEQVTTASLPALQAYSRGARLGDVQGDFAGGLLALQEAVRLDSSFASAWRKASAYAFNLGRPASEDLRYAREAYRLRDRVAGSERLLIEATYLTRVASRRAADAYLAHALSPASGSLALRILGRNTEAESVSMAALRQDSLRGRPSPYQAYVNLLSAQIARGEEAAARGTLATLAREAPGAAMTADLEGLMAWRFGGADGYDAFLRRERGSDNPAARSSQAAFSARLSGARGQLASFARQARIAAQLQSTVWNPGDPVNAELEVIVASAVHRGAIGEGVARLDSVRRSIARRSVPAVDRHDAALASAYAVLGRADVARPLLAAYLRALTPEERLATWSLWHNAEGEIALAEGRHEQALAAFRRAASADSGRLEPAWTGYSANRIGFTLDRMGQRDSAAAYLAAFVEGQSSPDPLALPLALRLLGELAEARGDLPEAIRRYRAFAQLWRDADPELQPQVADVRRRIAALEAREARAR